MNPDPCTCCYLRFAPERFSLTDRRPPVCVECAKHVGRPEQRDRDHVREWRAAYAESERGANRRIANIRAAMEGVERELASTKAELEEAVKVISGDYFKASIGDLHKRLESTIVIEQSDKMEAAYRQRSRAFAVLWRIDRLHNTYDSKVRGQCKCGALEDRCSVLEILKPFATEIDAWESREKERLQSGKTHGLPDDHPAVRRLGPAYGSRMPPRPIKR